MKTLKIRGTGDVKSSPDLAIFGFTVNVREKKYEDCSEYMNARINFLYEDVIKAGFKKSDLKTTFFDVETVYEYVNKKSVFKGYSSKSKFRLEFDFSKEKLNELLSILGKSHSGAEFRISFEIKDKETFRNKLLENAVLDSKNKAGIIAKSAGLELGEILSVDYSWNVIRFESDFEMNERCCQMAVEAPSPDYDFEPDEVKAKDSITVLWEIK